MRALLPILLLLTACDAGTERRPGFSDPEDTASARDLDDDTGDDTGDDTDEPWGDTGPCPADMVPIGGETCMDRYEAPNVAGALPFVMFTFTESEAWCAARGKRLCFDDEWQAACEGSEGHAYVYGPVHEPGRCNDDEVWRVYDQSKLGGWPYGLGVSGVESLDALLDLARAHSATASAAADHVEHLYQADGSGANTGCVGEAEVYDLNGNVEEWTRRRDGGTPSFHGALKGRYWSESRTCQSRITSHGDAFRFYEIGFRCCLSL